MSVGYPVDKGTLDMTAANAAVQLRNAFGPINIVNQFLLNNPVVDGVDPLLTSTAMGYPDSGYSTGDLTTLRTYFSTFAALYTANMETFELGSELTGLQ